MVGARNTGSTAWNIQARSQVVAWIRSHARSTGFNAHTALCAVPEAACLAQYAATSQFVQWGAVKGTLGQVLAVSIGPCGWATGLLQRGVCNAILLVGAQSRVCTWFAHAGASGEVGPLCTLWLCLGAEHTQAYIIAVVVLFAPEISVAIGANIVQDTTLLAAHGGLRHWHGHLVAL